MGLQPSSVIVEGQETRGGWSLFAVCEASPLLSSIRKPFPYIYRYNQLGREVTYHVDIPADNPDPNPSWQTNHGYTDVV
jgi:hypothetical protein